MHDTHDSVYEPRPAILHEESWDTTGTPWPAPRCIGYAHGCVCPPCKRVREMVVAYFAWFRDTPIWGDEGRR